MSVIGRVFGFMHSGNSSQAWSGKMAFKIANQLKQIKSKKCLMFGDSNFTSLSVKSGTSREPGGMGPIHTWAGRSRRYRNWVASMAWFRWSCPGSMEAIAEDKAGVGDSLISLRTKGFR